MSSDWHGIYKSDEAAHKAAANEIRAMNAVIATQVPHLHTTLSVLFRIGAHVVIATALAPISAETLCYGSGDAARTIHVGADAPHMVTLMSSLAKALNLKQHIVTDGQQQQYEIWTGVDVEGHRATQDGRFYYVMWHD